MKKFIGCAVTKDFEQTVHAFDTLCSKKYLDRSRIIREAIRKEVQELLKQYPDVKELIERTALLYLQHLGVNT